MENDTLSWQTYEYVQKKRRVEWFWAVGIIAVAVIVVSIIFQNFLFAILVLLSVFTLFLFASREPRLVTFSITARGILAGKLLYPYTSLESFCISKTDPESINLLVKTTKNLSPLITIPLSNVNPDDVGGLLAQYLAEEELSQPPLQKIMDSLGF